MGSRPVFIHAPKAAPALSKPDAGVGDTNGSAASQFTRELLPTLLGRPRAHIVNVSSMCGFFAAGRLAAYCTTKFGLAGFSEALRCEYGRQGLGVTTVCPGFVSTDFFRSTQCETTERQAPVPPRWLCTSADHVARKVMAAIRHDRRLVLATPLGYAAYYLKRFAPGLIDRLQRIGRRGKIKRKAAQLALADTSRPDKQTWRAA
ncbi:MAG: SDR family NAD(P)-dependent oxidoreductase [Planctomycetes bacterium]|nr:SDR family NAD(P)-dependent oxidoreductase [Planctomycetota bacterium]